MMKLSLLERFPRHSDRLRLAGWLIFALGLLAALAVYVAASNGPDPLLRNGYEIVGGQVYASEQADAARQVQIERVGGKAAVWAVEFNEWQAAQFQGRRLALTLVVLSALAALGCSYIAGLMDEPSDVEDT